MAIPALNSGTTMGLIQSLLAPASSKKDVAQSTSDIWKMALSGGGGDTTNIGTSIAGLSGLGAMGDLGGLLNSVYSFTNPFAGIADKLTGFASDAAFGNPFSVAFNPQNIVKGTTPNGAVNAPGTVGQPPKFTSLFDFFNKQGKIKPGQTNQLAFQTGRFADQISGIRFTAFNPAKILKQFPGLVK